MRKLHPSASGRPAEVDDDDARLAAATKALHTYEVAVYTAQSKCVHVPAHLEKKVTPIGCGL